MRLILKGSSRCGTTITRRILSSHPNIWMTNELRLYCRVISHPQKGISYPALSSEGAEEYFRAIKKRVTLGEPLKYYGFPKGFDLSVLVERCLENLTEDTLEGRLSAIEGTIFKDKYTYFGDKGGDLPVISSLSKTKVIFIHRDGRDVAASGARKKRGGVAPWSNSPAENAEHWATNMKSFLDHKESFDDLLVIKFEDYINDPDKNFELISDFLGVDILPYKSLINPNKTHKGYYKNLWKDWEKEASTLTVEMLRRLGYV